MRVTLHRRRRRARGCSASRSPAQARRAGHAEQRARRARRGARPPREGALLRGRAAVRDEVHPPRGRGRQEPAGRHPAAHGREQVPARCDVGSPDELVGGFPKTREELFAYRAIILGSVEAASFSPEQLRMLADFVSKRGGGLLMLGGRRSFAEGGWAGTPVGRSAAGRVRPRRAARERARVLRAPHGPPDARRRHLPGHAARATPKQASNARVERHADGQRGQPGAARSSRAPRCC